MENPNERPHRKAIRNFFDLTAWQRARELVRTVYGVSKAFPRDEAFGLTSQMRRAAVSVPSNIAEGYGRGTRKDYVHFLHSARGSLYEVQTQLFLAQDLGYVEARAVAQATREADGCARLISALIGSLTKESN